MNKKLLRILSVVLAAVMLFSLCSCNTYEEEEEQIKYASAVPSGKIAIVERLNSVLASAKSGKPAVKYSLDQGTGKCECENKYVKGSFKTVANLITDEDFGMETKYGEDATEILPLMGSAQAGSIDASDVRSAVITDNKTDKTYTIVITINPEENPEQENSIYGKLFKIEKDADILANFENIKHLMTADSYSANYKIGSIKAVVDKSTDHLIKLELHRDIRVETQVTGQGTLAEVGTVPLSFDYNSTAKYELDWDNPETSEIEA